MAEPTPARLAGGHAASAAPVVLHADQIAELIAVLLRRGYDLVGPTLRDGAIVLERITSAAQLPAGCTDDQQPGHYRVKHREDQALFAYSVGPHSWKKYLHPPEMRLWSAERQDTTFRILSTESPPRKPYAFLGVRACDLAAIALQDRVLIGNKYLDAIYARRREELFIVAVQCSQAAATCFCAAMGTGPRARNGFDLALTELMDQRGHRLVVEVGSHRGADVMAELGTTPAGDDDLKAAENAAQTAARQQVRGIHSEGIRDLLYRNFDHSRWDNVAARCLACANCTMVCPTCFCTTVEDVSDVTGQHAERWRRWDSCFTQNFSYIHGGSIRASGKARYRQWMTHKLASWIDQFGSSGCVGCGRCITWCPVGIDITEEARAIREAGDHGNS